MTEFPIVTTMLLGVLIAIPPTAASAIAILVSLRQSRTVSITLAEVGKVHALVNSQMTTLKADLAIAQGQIETLLGRIEELTK